MDGSDSLRIVESGCVYRTHGAKSEIHRPHALQLLVPLDGIVEASVDGVEVALPRGKAMLVSPDVPRRVYGGAPRVSLLLDPESLSAPFPSFARGASVAVLGGAVGRRLEELARHVHGASQLCTETAEFGLKQGRDVLADAGFTRPFPLDDRVRRALDLYRQPWLQLDHPSIAQRAAIAPDHLSHLFTDQVGISAKRYSLWIRTVAAVERMSGGASVTEAARQARFSDGAHFSRACRRYFGRSPSMLPARQQDVLGASAGERSCAPWPVAFAQRLDRASSGP